MKKNDAYALVRKILHVDNKKTFSLFENVTYLDFNSILIYSVHCAL